MTDTNRLVIAWIMILIATAIFVSAVRAQDPVSGEVDEFLSREVQEWCCTVCPQGSSPCSDLCFADGLKCDAPKGCACDWPPAVRERPLKQTHMNGRLLYEVFATPYGDTLKVRYNADGQRTAYQLIEGDWVSMWIAGMGRIEIPRIAYDSYRWSPGAFDYIEHFIAIERTYK